MPLEEDDPVVASYDVFISQPDPSAVSTQTSQLYVLQYPSHRTNTKPYSSSRSQKPTSLRLKPNTGIIEVDVPILTTDNYNRHLGSQFGKAMHESQVAHPTTSHGLSGGFSHNQSSNTSVGLSDIPEHDFTDTSLHTQTLGGKLSTNTDKDPIYMLATLKPNREIYLQHLDALVQLRPQLHHIDAADELKKRVESAANRAKIGGPSSASNSHAVDPSAPPKLETKAIEMKIKDTTKDDPKDRNLNLNAKLLRDIQNDPWQRYDWIEGAGAAIDQNITNGDDPTEQPRPQLKAALDNDEWLNKMSSPGIELRTRLKGRDRERARRKRQERARASRAEVAAAGLVGPAGVGVAGEAEGEGAMDTVSGSESSGSEDEAVQDENGNVGADEDGALGQDGDGDGDGTQGEKERHVSPEVQIKLEGPERPVATATTAATTSAPNAPKRRGRPPKNKAA